MKKKLFFVFLLLFCSFNFVKAQDEYESVKPIMDGPYIEGKRTFVITNGKDSAELRVESGIFKISRVYKYEQYYKVIATKDNCKYLIVGKPDIMYHLKKRKRYKMVLCSLFVVRRNGVYGPVPGSTGYECLMYKDDVVCVDFKHGIKDIFLCLKVLDQ